MSREKLIELIKTYDTFGLKEYNKLIKMYGKGNVCIALQKLADSATNKEEFNAIMSKYSSAYISMYLDCNKLTDEEYTNLLNKFGEETVLKYYEEIDEENEEKDEEYKKYFKSDISTQTEFIKSLGDPKVLTREEEKDLFEELDRLRSNLKIAKKEQNVIYFDDIYSVIYSIANRKHKDKLEKISKKLCPEQKEVVDRYLDLCKKNKEIMPNYIYLKQFFGNKSFPKNLIKDKELDEQLDNIISTYDIIDKIWISNIKLAIKQANRLWRSNNCHSYGLDVMDLVMEGSTGILVGIERFDISRGFKFGTYATYWINQAITRTIENNGSLIRIPVHVHEDCRKILGTKEKLSRINGITPSDEEIANYLNISVDKVRLVDNYLNKMNVCSLDAPAHIEKSNKEEGDSLVSFIKDDDMTPEEKAMETAMAECLYAALGDLTDREKIAIIERFGLYGGEIKTLEEVGNDLHVTRERIRQLEAKAMRKLRHNNNLRDFAGKKHRGYEY